MENPLFGIFLGVLLISALLMGCRFLLVMFVYGRAPGRRAIREAHRSRLARLAVRDIDREYEELLHS